MDNPIPIMLHGGNGRMATAIRSATLTLPDVQLLAAYPSRWDGDRPRPPLPPGAILVDFTHADALLAMLEAGAAAPFPILTGTSGLNDRHHALLRRFAQSAPVLQVSNFCLGAMIAADLVARISKVTAPFGTWDAAVTDLHNVNKVDRPSATAEAWSHAWGGARGGDPVPIVSLRLGDGVSEHTLVAAGPGERLEVAHRLLNRTAAVSGVLAGLRFLGTCQPGLYTGADLLAFLMGPT